MFKKFTNDEKLMLKKWHENGRYGGAYFFEKIFNIGELANNEIHLSLR